MKKQMLSIDFFGKLKKFITMIAKLYVKMNKFV